MGGPYARHILEKLTDVPLDNLSFPFSTNKMIEVAGHQVRALRVSFVGELGWELHIPSERWLSRYRQSQHREGLPPLAPRGEDGRHSLGERTPLHLQAQDCHRLPWKGCSGSPEET